MELLELEVFEIKVVENIELVDLEEGVELLELKESLKIKFLLSKEILEL